MKPTYPISEDERPIPRSWYWPMFSHMATSHDLTLTDSECEDILQVAKSMFEERNKWSARSVMAWPFKAFSSVLFEASAICDAVAMFIESYRRK